MEDASLASDGTYYQPLGINVLDSSTQGSWELLPMLLEMRSSFSRSGLCGWTKGHHGRSKAVRCFSHKVSQAGEGLAVCRCEPVAEALKLHPDRGTLCIS